jgi:hypothetical protein
MAASGELVVAGVRSPYSEVGHQGAREAVVFVHGNPGPATDWSDPASNSQSKRRKAPKHAFRGDDLVVKTLLLAALVPNVPALNGLTAPALRPDRLVRKVSDIEADIKTA